ncbi:ATP-binding protein [Phytomonospora sp. NPDC050363]|uniref:sensor histidine kinase n=1 Tax=Phytomonospora sp. NPDC050363 TaxID=3155642 RepID=UPI0033D06650
MKRLTIRARLTLVYGGLFLLAGIVLLALTYVLVSQRIPGGSVENNVSGSGVAPSTPTTPGPETTYVSQMLEDAQRDTVDELVTQGAVALLVVGAIAVALGWLLAGHLLRPLHRVTETARRIADAPAAASLHERIDLGGPHDEVRELADTFDVMLERLDKSFDGQRRFIANASHELRTPLTLNRALIEVAVHRGPASDEVRHLGETLLAVNARHERLIEGLLLLADSERQLTDRAFVDLADIVEHVSEIEPPGSVVVHTAAAEATTTGDPILLERLVQNLVENGVRHNTEGGWVRVASRTAEDGSAVVEVSNTGPVVPRYELASLFEPFRRLGAERLSATSPGAGLGLSIVRAVAQAHGGGVRAEPREGGGLVVTVTLPPG